MTLSRMNATMNEMSIGSSLVASKRSSRSLTGYITGSVIAYRKFARFESSSIGSQEIIARNIIKSCKIARNILTHLVITYKMPINDKLHSAASPVRPTIKEQTGAPHLRYRLYIYRRCRPSVVCRGAGRPRRPRCRE